MNLQHSNIIIKVYEIRRKGNMITKRVFLPEDARQRIDEYLKWREEVQDKVENNFLFINTSH